jgi:hypothetical protein
MIRKIGSALVPAGLIAIAIAILATDHVILRAVGMFTALFVLGLVRTKKQ